MSSRLCLARANRAGARALRAAGTFLRAAGPGARAGTRRLWTACFGPGGCRATGRNLPNSGPEQPKPRPQSAPSRFTSRLDTLEDQLLVPPSPVRLPVVEQQEELPQAQARAGSRRRGRHARGEKPNYSAGMWWKRREDPGKDVFQQWLLATAAKEPRGGAVLTEPMLKTLKSELKLKFRQFQEEMPFFSAQDLYENKILSSHYRVKVRSQARKEAAQKEGKEVKEEKVVRSKTHRRPSTNPTLLSVKSMATRLQDSQNAIPETKETREFLYMLRREQGNEIYEGLRKAYYHTKEVPPEAPPTRSQSHRRL
ncbi:Uncharacterized protein SCF082_LOCUS53124 [Durusdinium trenchii]|uniref:Uncharacterized protein n=1 Tax=Durusdinium trenchii TaxID=1381693 RepID=A0ABP0SQS9_9DINO